MEWKKGTLRSLLKLNKEKLIFVFCSGLLLFVLALPTEGSGQSGTGGVASTAGATDYQSGQAGVGNRAAYSAMGQYAGDEESATGNSGTNTGAFEDTYETALELRVRNILSGVEGVGEVEVMVSLKPDDDTSMFEETSTQEVLGIIISAEGGGSSVVKAEISEAMEALFNLPSHKIKVLKRVKEGV